MDYFDSAFNNDESKSEFLNDLTSEQKAQWEQLKKIINHQNEKVVSHAG